MTAPISIDANDRTPIYAQLERGIRVAIATRRMRPGDQLPTVRQLAVDLRDGMRRKSWRAWRTSGEGFAVN